MALLTLSGVAKSYDPKRPLIEDASLVVAEDDRIGLIGPNGAGKSTLLRLLAGLEAPDAGARVARRGLRIGYLEQEPRFAPELSVREIVHGGLEGRGELLDDLDEVYRELAEPGLATARLAALGARQERLQHRLDELGGHTVEHRVEAAIHGVGLPDPEARCGTLSGGEARRTALARLLVAEPELLLLDEPTNHLDAFVVAWLERQLAALAAPLVLVTHDRYLLDRVTSRIVEIERGRLLAYEGGYRRYLELRAARLEGEAKAESARLNLLRRETAWIRRGAPARSTKARARIDRYEQLVEAAPPPAPEDLELAFPPGPRLGSKVVELRGVSHRYGAREVLPPLDLKLEPGMRLGVVGPNGAGKTTLLRILLGRLAPASGEVVIGETVRFATIDQKREDLDPRRSVLEEIAGRNDHVTIGGRAIHVVGFLDRFLFPGTRKEVAVGSLSGGERGRVLLAKLLLAGGNLLVLDEPTNDLDLGTLRALEEALCAFAGAVVVVSHDRWFLDRVATHVLWLDGCGGARLHTGDLSSLIERREREEAAMAAAATRVEGNVSSLPAGKPAIAAPERRRLTQRERREMEEAFAAVAAREQEIVAIDAALADPALYQGDPARVRELHGRRAEAEDELAAAMARWEELAGRDGS